MSPNMGCGPSGVNISVPDEQNSEHIFATRKMITVLNVQTAIRGTTGGSSQDQNETHNKLPNASDSSNGSKKRSLITSHK